MDFRQWYAIFVISGHEESVKENIEEELRQHSELNAVFLVPKRELIERRGGKFEKVKKIMFPGYVILGTSHIKEIYIFTRKIKGVLKLLQNDMGFQEIRFEEIAPVVYMMDDDGVIGVSELNVDEDRWIEVISGPLKGYEGLISKMDRRKGRVMVSFKIADKKCDIWLSAKFVENFEDEK